MMVIPSHVVGIEIKSDADTYARLRRQVKDYNQYFDYNYVVAGTSHAMHIEEYVPEWWGIITVEKIDGEADFYILRKPGENPDVNEKKKLSLLWRPELAHIQELNHLPGYRQRSKQFVIEKIALNVPQDILHEQISRELFERDYTQIEDAIRAYKRQHTR